MSKNGKRHSGQGQKQGGSPVFVDTPAPKEELVTSEQARDVQNLAEEAQLVATQEGAPDEPSPASPPVGMTSKQAIHEAREARRLYDAAKRSAEERSKNAQSAEEQARKLSQQATQQKADLDKKKAALDELERKLGEREISLVEREANAENGFVAERRRVLGPLEDAKRKLQEEIDQVSLATERRGSEEEAGCRRRAEERTREWQQEEQKRSERWKLDEQEHAKVLSAERARARTDIQDERARSLAEVEAERKRLREETTESRRGLESEREGLARLEKDLHVRRTRLSGDIDIFEEDKREQERKVTVLAAARVEMLQADLTAERETLTSVKAERDRYFKAVQAHEDLRSRFGESSPEQVLDQLRQTERRVDELQLRLRESLGQSSAKRLSELEEEKKRWEEDRLVLEVQLAQARTRADKLRVAAVGLESAHKQVEALETNKRLLEQVIADLGAQVDKYTQADRDRNPLQALLDLDEKRELNFHVSTTSMRDAGPTLKDLVKIVQHRMVDVIPKRALYYTDRDVRCFLAGLAMSRLVLLQGISGTGKTSLPLAFAASLRTPAEVVPVQAGWRDRQDLIGYYNAFQRHYYAQSFLQALYTAGTPAFADRPFLIVLDEINLSRVEQFFADFLSALELEEGARKLTLMNDSQGKSPKLMKDGRELPIPRNVWFVGTANHDETTTDFADKTYDRSHIMELPRRDRTAPFKHEIQREWPGPLSYEALNSAFEDACARHAGHVQKAIDWLGSREGIAPILEDQFRVAWGNRLERDVERFVPVVLEAGGDLGEAMDHLLETKVLRKLRDRHDVHASGLEQLKKRLEERWKLLDGKPERCLRLLDREVTAKRTQESAE